MSYHNTNICIAIVLGCIIGFVATKISEELKEEATIEEAAKEEDVMNGYYDPVNKIMCYWVKGSKATPACLYADWPVPPQEESAQEPMRYVY